MQQSGRDSGYARPHLRATFKGVVLRGDLAGLKVRKKASIVKASGARQLGAGVSIYPLEYNLFVGMATAAK